MKHLLTLLIITLTISIYAQSTQHYLYYSLSNFKGEKVILYSVIGGNTFPVDTTYRQSTGAFVFNNTEKLFPGMYKLVFNDSIYTEVIINNEDIVIESDARNIIQNMVVKKSLENTILFNYWKYALQIRDSITRLSFKRDKIEKRTYNSNHPEIIKINERIEFFNNEIFYYIERQSKNYPKHFAPKLLKSYIIPTLERYNSLHPEKKYTSEEEFYSNHFFDNIDFSDPRFVNTKVLFITISDYIETFSKPASTVKYNNIIDEVMIHAKENTAIYEYCVNLFIRTFENSIWEDVMVHIIDNYYLSSDMKNAKKKKYYTKLSERIKSLKPGVESPNIIMKDTSGIFQNMHNTVAKAKMLVFYSSDCPHCIETLPKLVEIYNMYKTQGFEAFGISIDEDRELWTKEINDLKLNWISLSDLKGLNSPIIDTYNITNTPSIIILNKDNIIMTKPKNIDDIHATLVELLNQ